VVVDRRLGHDRPVAGAELLPGGFVLPGLVDAHAHPGRRLRAGGPLPLAASAARSDLVAWARAGITLVRDLGSAVA
jgi:imidazolonepropionase-like amidohydrolase